MIHSSSACSPHQCSSTSLHMKSEETQQEIWQPADVVLPPLVLQPSCLPWSLFRPAPPPPPPPPSHPPSCHCSSLDVLPQLCCNSHNGCRLVQCAIDEGSNNVCADTAFSRRMRRNLPGERRGAQTTPHALMAEHYKGHVEAWTEMEG